MTIIVSDNIRDLTGHGTEYLTDRQGNVIAVFHDGQMPGESPSVDTESPTLVN